MNTRSTEQGPRASFSDGTEFKIWEDETDYQKEYCVDLQHPAEGEDHRSVTVFREEVRS